MHIGTSLLNNWMNSLKHKLHRNRSIYTLNKINQWEMNLFCTFVRYTPSWFTLVVKLQSQFTHSVPVAMCWCGDTEADAIRQWATTMMRSLFHVQTFVISSVLLLVLVIFKPWVGEFQMHAETLEFVANSCCSGCLHTMRTVNIAWTDWLCKLSWLDYINKFYD